MSSPPVAAWSSLNPDFSLLPGEIHVWRAALDLPAAGLSECRDLLDAGEKERAERLLRPEDRLRFIASRGLLRKLLGWYLGRPPEQLRFGYRERGKPFLAEAGRGPVPRFNLSHSEGLALFAFAADRELGVDVERQREELRALALARRYFHPREAAALAALDARAARREFFRLWTRKEAWLKARGEGISGLDRAVEEDRRYCVVPLDVGEDYQAALAYEGPAALRLALFQWI